MRHSGFPPLTLVLALALSAAGFVLPALAQTLVAPPLSAALGGEATTTVTFHFVAATAVGAVSVVTQGLAGRDFTRDATTPGTCASTTYPGGGSCTVVVDFRPAAVGPVAGAAVLFDAANMSLQTAYLSGIGVGPLVTLDQAPLLSPATVLVAAGTYAPVQTMLDAAGDIFLADGVGDDIVEIRPAAPNPVASVLGANLDFTSIQGEALDGAGNLYALFTDAIYQIPDQNGAYGSGRLIYSAPNGDVLTGIAADGAGSLYVADWNAGLFKLAAGTWTSTRMGSDVLPGGAVLVAADAAGDVWASDRACNVYKLPPAGANVLVASGASTCISGLAADAAGDLLLTSGTAGGSVTTVPAAGGPPTAIATEAKGNNAHAPAFDRQGNVYFASADLNNNYTVEEVVRSAAAISYANVVTGSSSPVQTLILGNVGNAPLTGITAAVTNAIPGPSEFTLQPAASAPCGSSLPAGASCGFTIQYTPAVSGNAAAATISIADNAANAPQTVALSGNSFRGPVKLGFSLAPPRNATAPAALGPVVVQVESYAGQALSSGDTVLITVSGAGVNCGAQGTAGQPVDLSSCMLPFGATYSVVATDVSENLTPVTASVLVGAAPLAVGRVAAQSGGAGVGAPQAVTFSFGASTEQIQNIRVTTLGAEGQDFVRDPDDSGAGACAVGAQMQKAACTVLVDFTPRDPGMRAGAVTVTTNRNTYTDFIHRVATAPLATLDVAAPSPRVAATGVQATALALDGAGDLYVADEANHQVVEQLNPAACASGCQRVVGAGAWSRPSGIAVDGAGTLYVADTGYGTVEAIAPGSAMVQIAAMVSSAAPIALAQNPAGLLFIGNNVSQSMSQICDLNATCLVPAAQPGMGAHLSSLAVDAAGDVYFPGSGTVEELSVGTNSPTAVASGFTGPLSLAVDAGGDLYVMDGGTGTLSEIASGGGQTVLLSGLQADGELAGVAVDPAGNVFVADLAHSCVLELQRSAVALALSTTYGVAAPAEATLSNSGNGTLRLAGVAVAGAAFSQTSGNAADCGAGTAIAAGQPGCVVGVSLAATVPVGTASGSVSITDNSNNVASATQSVSLAGTVAPATLTITANDATMAAGAGSLPGFAGTMTGAVNGDTFVESFTTTAVVSSPPGNYTVTPSVTGAGVANYAVSARTGTLTVIVAAQTINFPAIPAHVVTDGPFALEASASSGLPVSYTLLSGPARLAGGTLTLIGVAGAVTVEATQGGNQDYSAAPAQTQSFIVSAAPSPEVSLSASSLNFGLQAVGTVGSPQSVVVRNSGSVALTGLTISSAAVFPISGDQCGNELAPGSSCGLEVAFAPRAAGSQNGMLTVSAAGGTFAVDALAGTGSDFTLAAGPVPAIAAGKSAVIALSLASMAGDAQTVALTCSAAGVGAGCSIAPGVVPLSGSSIVSALLTVTTSASTAVAPSPLMPRWPWAGLGAVLLIAALGLLLADRRGRRRRWKLAWLVAAVALCAACGGGPGLGATSSSGKAPSVTASISVTVRAVSSAGVTHTLQVPVKVTAD